MRGEREHDGRLLLLGADWGRVKEGRKEEMGSIRGWVGQIGTDRPTNQLYQQANRGKEREKEGRGCNGLEVQVSHDNVLGAPPRLRLSECRLCYLPKRRSQRVVGVKKRYGMDTNVGSIARVERGTESVSNPSWV